MNPLFPGKSEVDELNRIFKLLGKFDANIDNLNYFYFQCGIIFALI